MVLLYIFLYSGLRLSPLDMRRAPEFSPHSWTAPPTPPPRTASLSPAIPKTLSPIAQSSAVLRALS